MWKIFKTGELVLSIIEERDSFRKWSILSLISEKSNEKVISLKYCFVSKQSVLKINTSLLPQNLLEKSTERETRQEYALAMIQCKVLKQLENLDQQKYDDEDISEDIKFLLDKLGESVQDLRYALQCAL